MAADDNLVELSSAPLPDEAGAGDRRMAQLAKLRKARERSAGWRATPGLFPEDAAPPAAVKDDPKPKQRGLFDA